MTIRIFKSATSYPRTDADWQGVFIRNIADGLASQTGVTLSLWAPEGPRHAAIRYACNDADRDWLAQLAKRGGIAQQLRENKAAAAMAAGSLLYRLSRAYRRAAADTDIFHVNWLQNALPLAGVARPALVTVLGTDFKLLELPGMRAALRRVLAGRRAVLAPNAEWMCPELESSFGDVARVQAVPLGIDDRWYGIRSAPVTPARWLAVVRLTREKIGPLFEWGRAAFADGRRELHLIGPNVGNLTIPEWVHYHGPASPEVLARDWFPHAAGLITLSQHSEGRPQVMLEAMAAGLPIVASDLPAHVDFIEDEHTGRIVRDRQGLSPALEWIESPGVSERLAENCRRFAYDNYGTWEDCAARYLSLYETILP